MKKNFNYKISYASETGLRERNEDAFFIGKNKTKQLLAVVCDGIGSDDESQIASHLTTEAFKRAFTKKIKVCNFYRFYNKCISTVSKQISRTSATKNIKMGTTIVCSLITGNKVECASMGDSRIYHYTKNDDK
jgi:protein phosphatase